MTFVNVAEHDMLLRDAWAAINLSLTAASSNTAISPRNRIAHKDSKSRKMHTSAEGDFEGPKLGGLNVGSGVGFGVDVGPVVVTDLVGTDVGFDDNGENVGSNVGRAVIRLVGFEVGIFVSSGVGSSVGSGVGIGVLVSGCGWGWALFPLLVAMVAPGSG